MKSAVIVFPGSNCDRDMAVALTRASGREAAMVWHKDASLPDGLDMVAIPGGWWLDSRKFKKHDVAAHLVNLAWNGLAGMEPDPELRTRSTD